jgi:hypothetical protein
VQREAEEDWGKGEMAVKPDAAETRWQRFWATYRFRRNFGRESWWASFWGAVRAAWRDGRERRLWCDTKTWPRRGGHPGPHFIVSGQSGANIARRSPTRNPMRPFPMPLKLSDDELDAVLAAARPLDVRVRDAFLQEDKRGAGPRGASRWSPMLPTPLALPLA